MTGDVTAQLMILNSSIQNELPCPVPSYRPFLVLVFCKYFMEQKRQEERMKLNHFLPFEHHLPIGLCRNVVQLVWWSCPREAPPAARRMFYGASLILLRIGTQVCSSPACPWELEPRSHCLSAHAGQKASVLDSAVSRCARRWCPRGHNSAQLAAKSQGAHWGGRWIKRTGFQRVGSDLKRTTCFPCQIRRLLLIPFFQGLKTSVLAPVPYIICYFPSTAAGLSICKSSSAV